MRIYLDKSPDDIMVDIEQDLRETLRVDDDSEQTYRIQEILNKSWMSHEQKMEEVKDYVKQNKLTASQIQFAIINAFNILLKEFKSERDLDQMLLGGDPNANHYTGS